jgi:nucleoside 2-deoxyribosyltransferase
MEGLEAATHEVVNAHRRERWGESLDSPANALRADIDELRGVDAVVAHVGNPPSPGVQFELGAATVLGLPMVLLLDRGAATPYLLPGLPSLARVATIEFDPGETITDRVDAALSELTG